jgi:hypothetical protein
LTGALCTGFTLVKLKQDCAHMKTKGARPSDLHNLYHHEKT